MHWIILELERNTDPSACYTLFTRCQLKDHSSGRANTGFTQHCCAIRTNPVPCEEPVVELLPFPGTMKAQGGTGCHAHVIPLLSLAVQFIPKWAFTYFIIKALRSDAYQLGSWQGTEISLTWTNPSLYNSLGLLSASSRQLCRILMDLEKEGLRPV